MPLARISLMKRNPEDCGQKVGKVVYQAMVDTIMVFREWPCAVCVTVNS